MAKRALCWLRRDLRLTDHAPLALACQEADEVAVAFVFDSQILGELKDRDDRRVTFIHRSLEELDAKLRRLGSRLIVLHGDPVVEIPQLAKELGADLVVAGRDYEPYAKTRDSAVEALVPRFELVKDHVIFEGDEIVSQSGGHFRVYSPYRRAWDAAFVPEMASAFDADLNKLVPESALGGVGVDWSLEQLGFEASELWLDAGEDAALARLNAFGAKIDAYGEARDQFGVDGTSGMSVHLRFGTISVRACVRQALQAGSEGGAKWLSELIWREFYQMILDRYPRVTASTFNPVYDKLEWPGSDDHFEAWANGMTGYPVVDAAMRCLKATGWMHNRLRMVVASFLTKDLLVDYRRGEAHFARYLLDFDLAQNNGGWQWAASTGCDPQPYFRIFNPLLQSRRFDPGAGFIRRWCPELSGFDDDRIHWPHEATLLEQVAADCDLGSDYPHPIVNHSEQRDRAVQLLESAARA